MTTPPWAAELELTLDAARDLIAAAFPDLADAPARRLGEGWDNLAVEVGGWVFRLPRRRLGAEALEAELAVMPAVAAALDLPVSAPLRAGGPAPGIPWRFAGYPKLPGLTGCDPRLDEAARARAAAPLGRALARLHALDLPAPPDLLARADHVGRSARVRERVRGWPEAAAVDAALAALCAAPPHRGPPRLVHGDLYARHVLLHPSGDLAGIIDWGDVHRGDPALDLAVAWTLLPEPAHATFLDAYAEAGGALDEGALARARFRGLFTSVMLIAYGQDVGDADLLAVGRRGLARVL